MRIFFRTVPVALINLLQSLNVGSRVKGVIILLLNFLTYLHLFLMYLLKSLILWPVMFLTAVMASLLMTIPILFLVNPNFTQDDTASALVRVLHQLPALWMAFILLSIMIDMLLFLRREYNREFTRAYVRMVGGGCDSVRHKSGSACGGDLSKSEEAET